MKPLLLLILCHLPVGVFCQAVVKGRWTVECGASTNTLFREPACLNLRYVSPRFRWSAEELSEEEEKRIDEFRNSRIMVEMIYAPPIKVLGLSLNLQSRLLKHKRLSMDLYGGLKFFPVAGPDFETMPYLRNRQIWYMNLGLIFQLNLGVIAPFADIGGDRIITIGTEVNFRAIYRKPKKRYNLHVKKG